MPTTQELYRSPNLAVRAVGGFSANRLVITFDSYSDDRRLDRPGFGEAFFVGHEVNAIHFIPIDNDWFQYPDMLDAAAVAGRVARSYDRVLAYGSSMGGYAAIRFGGAAGASVAFALSPQFSIDPQAPPFDRCWAVEAACIDFRYEREPVPFVARSYIAFDPNILDGAHAELYCAHTEVRPIAVRNSGHTCSGFLADLGLLQKTVLALLEGDADCTAITAEARSRRKQTGHFFQVLAQKSRSPQRRLELSRRALEMTSGNVNFSALYAKALVDIGNAAEAATVLDRALRRWPGHPSLLKALGLLYRSLGDIDRLGPLVRELTQRLPRERQALEQFLADAEAAATRKGLWRQRRGPLRRPGTLHRSR